jgi:hypothetical protein
MALSPAGVALGLVLAGDSRRGPAHGLIGGLLGCQSAGLLLQVATAMCDQRRLPPPPPYDAAPAPEPGPPPRAAAADARPPAAGAPRRATAGGKRSGPVRQRPAGKSR